MNGEKAALRRPFAIACAALDLETIRDRARRAGLSTSAYVRERLRAQDPATHSEPLAHLAPPSDAEWRDLVSEVRHWSASRDRDVDAAGMVFMLLDARMDEMMRWGRQRELRTLLHEVVGEARSQTIVRAVAERVASAKPGPLTRAFQVLDRLSGKGRESDAGAASDDGGSTW